MKNKVVNIYIEESVINYIREQSLMQQRSFNQQFAYYLQAGLGMYLLAGKSSLQSFVKEIGENDKLILQKYRISTFLYNNVNKEFSQIINIRWSDYVRALLKMGIAAEDE